MPDNGNGQTTLEKLAASWLVRNFGAFLRVVAAVIVGAWVVGGAHNPFTGGALMIGPKLDMTAASRSELARVERESQEADQAIINALEEAEKTRKQLIVEYRSGMANISNRVDMLTTTLHNLEGSHDDLRRLLQAELDRASRARGRNR